MSLPVGNSRTVQPYAQCWKVTAMPNTLTRDGLAHAINRRLGLSRPESLDLVEAVLGQVRASLSNGEKVKIPGFGTFVLRDKVARVGRNPKTGVEVPITARRVLTFRASPRLKDRWAR